MNTFEQIATIITAAGVIATPIGLILRKYIYFLKELERINSWNEKQQKDIHDSKINNIAQNRALLAMARSMEVNGFNHTIGDAIKTLEETILAQQAGDLIIFNDSKGEIAHIGIIEKVTSSTIYTIEGNTSDTTGVIANGGGVFKLELQSN